jgi:nucleoside-triphosphatase THEP1
MQFKAATKQQSRLRMTIDGPAGGGKTFTALRFAHALAAGRPIAFIDTERGSASKYVGEAPDGTPWAFDVIELTTFSPETYTEAIESAGRAGYAVLIIDSLSHAWEGKGGALEIKDRVGGNQFTAWRQVTPMHNRMIDAILQSSCHVITTMRSRMEYVQDTDEKGKVLGVRKVGMSPIQRPGMEYEMDVVCDIDWAHILTVSKSRCSAIQDAKREKPGPEFLTPLIEWLTSGAAAAAKPGAEELVNAARALRAGGDSPKTVADKLNVSIAEVVAWTSTPA